MELIISVDRKWKKKDYTISNFIMTLDGKQVYKCNCVEDTDRGLTEDMAIDEIKAKKVYGKTAIPTGKYKVIMSYSTKFGKKTAYAWCKGILPEVLGVKGYSGIRIHAGNSAEDSLGCILPGKNTKPGWVSESMITFKEVYKVMRPVFEAGGSVILKVG